MLDAYSQLVRIYDSYMDEFEPTTVPAKGNVIMPPVYYNKVRHTDKQPVYIADINKNGKGRISPAEVVCDDEYHSTLCPSTLSQRINGAHPANQEFQFFTKVSVLASPKTKKRWLSLYRSWIDNYPLAKEQVSPIIRYVENTDFAEVQKHIEADPYLIFRIDTKNIFVNNSALYYEYVDFYRNSLKSSDIYNIEECQDCISGTAGIRVLGKTNDFLGFGVNYANQAKLITKTQPGSTLENNDIFPTTKKNFASFVLTVENSLKIVLAFDYLCEIKQQFGDTRRLVFRFPDGCSFSQFLSSGQITDSIAHFYIMKIRNTKIVEQMIENHVSITVLEWKQNDPAKSTIVRCEEISVEDYVHNINYFVSFIHEYVDNFIERLKKSKNKTDFIPTFTIFNLLCNFYFRDTAIMHKRINTIYDCIVHGRPIQKYVLDDMMKHIIRMIQTQSMNQIQRHYKGYRSSKNYIFDSLTLLAGMIKYNDSFTQERKEDMENDRSYTYGQILAVYQKIEEVVVWNKFNNKSHSTIVEKNFSNFINNPNKYFLLIEQRMAPYLMQSYGKYKHMLEQLYGQLPYVSVDGIVPDNNVVTSNFLLGYYHQLNSMHKKTETEESTDE